MSTITPMKLAAPSQLGSSAGTIYTVPGATTARITEIVICNTDTVDRTYTISYVPSAGAQGATNVVFNGVTIGPNETHIHTLDSVLSTGDFVSAFASIASKVTMHISGAQIA